MSEDSVSHYLTFCITLFFPCPHRRIGLRPFSFCWIICVWYQTLQELISISPDGISLVSLSLQDKTWSHLWSRSVIKLAFKKVSFLCHTFLIWGKHWPSIHVLSRVDYYQGEPNHYLRSLWLIQNFVARVLCWLLIKLRFESPSPDLLDPWPSLLPVRRS